MNKLKEFIKKLINGKPQNAKLPVHVPVSAPQRKEPFPQK